MQLRSSGISSHRLSLHGTTVKRTAGTFGIRLGVWTTDSKIFKCKHYTRHPSRLFSSDCWPLVLGIRTKFIVVAIQWLFVHFTELCSVGMLWSFNLICYTMFKVASLMNCRLWHDPFSGHIRRRWETDRESFALNPVKMCKPYTRTSR